MALRVPGPEHLSEARAEVVWRDSAFPVPNPPPPGWVAAALAMASTVEGRPGEPVPTFAIGPERVRHRGTGRIGFGSLVCSCGGRACVHVAAVLLVVAFDDPSRRAAFDEPAWSLALAPLAAGARQVAVDVGPGHLRAMLRSPLAAPSLVVEVRWVRRWPDGSQDTGRAPKASDLRRAGKAADADVLDAITALEAGRRARSPALVNHLARALVAALARVSELLLDDAPARVSADVVRPWLRAEGEVGGALTLRWVPEIRGRWSEGGVVVRDDGVIALLADDVPDELAERLDRPLPTIPRAEVAAFVERLVVERRLPVALPAWLDPVGPPDRRCAVIALSEDGDELRVDLSLWVERGGLRATVDPRSVDPDVHVRGGGLVRRDPAWEREREDAFAAEVRGPLRLRGDEACDWLADVLPGLAERWVVEGTHTLARHQLRGSLVPRVHFSEGTDWFDLDVSFDAGGKPITGLAVCRDWLRGRRWFAIDGGGVARLPAQWLARHAATVDTLAEVRRTQDKLGSFHAWVASDLLTEVGGPAERWLALIRERDHVARVSVPDGFRGELRPYQQTALDWLCFLRRHGLHGLLADEMGLGKTVVALAFLASLPRGAPAIVVAPTSMLHAWLDAVRQFTPELRAAAWHGPERRRLDPTAFDVIVTTWAVLRRDADELAAFPFRAAVLDEAQALKNPASFTARAARRLTAETRLALTGTPVENDLLGLWSIYQFLMPGLLGRRSAFHARYHAAARFPDAAATRDLAARIRPFLLRRRKLDVAPELPLRTDVVLRVPLSERERALYELVRNTVRAAATGEAELDGRRHGIVLEGLLRLRQACTHPQLLPMEEARSVTRSAKLEALVDQLDVALPAGERVLVFSQWVRMLDEVSNTLGARGVRVLRLDGSTRDRAGVVAAFQDPSGPPVLLVSITAGGTGLTLHAADRVVLLDPWWNPAVEEQAAARAHRIGRTRPVTVVRMVAADTVEDRVLALQDRKRRLAEETVGGEALDVSALGTADLIALLG